MPAKAPEKPKPKPKGKAKAQPKGAKKLERKKALLIGGVLAGIVLLIYMLQRGKKSASGAPMPAGITMGPSGYGEGAGGFGGLSGALLGLLTGGQQTPPGTTVNPPSSGGGGGDDGGSDSGGGAESTPSAPSPVGVNTPTATSTTVYGTGPGSIMSPVGSPATGGWGSPAMSPSPATTVTPTMAPTTTYSPYNYTALGYGPLGPPQK